MEQIYQVTDNKQLNQIRSVIDKSRKRHIQLTCKELEEGYVLSDILASSKVDTKAAGESYARLLQIRLDKLENMSKSVIEQIDIVQPDLDEAGTEIDIQTRMMPPPAVKLTPDGGGGGGGSGWFYDLCDISSSSRIRAVCTASYNPNLWGIQWSDGSWSHFDSRSA